MTVFIDASVLVAIINEEPDRPELESAMAADPDRLTSGVAVWETVRAIARLPSNSLPNTQIEVDDFLAAAHIRIVPIGPIESAEATRAHARYGKGTGHPARLNMGDCFAYACARTNNARLLYKGDDFSHTDMAR